MLKEFYVCPHIVIVIVLCSCYCKLIYNTNTQRAPTCAKEMRSVSVSVISKGRFSARPMPTSSRAGMAVQKSVSQDMHLPLLFFVIITVIIIIICDTVVMMVGCVAQWKNVGYSPANFPVLHLTCS